MDDYLYHLLQQPIDPEILLQQHNDPEIELESLEKYSPYNEIVQT